MDAFGSGTDGIDAKYKDMILNFKNQMEAMQTQADGATLSQQKAFQENFDELNKQYGKAFEEIKAQMIRANVDMITSFIKNFEGLKENLKQNYDGIRSQAKLNFESNLKKFKDNCDETIKKIPVLPPKLYQDIIQALEVNQNKSTVEWEKGYNDVVQKLEKGFQEAIKRYTLPIAQSAVAAAMAKNTAGTSVKTAALAVVAVKPSVGQPVKPVQGKPAMVTTVKQGPAPPKAPIVHKK